MGAQRKVLHISDIHLEFGWTFDVLGQVGALCRAEPDAIALVIAGDLQAGGVVMAMNSLQRLKAEIDIPIVYVGGNHEFYGTDFKNEMYVLKQLQPEMEAVGIHWLENSSVDIEGVTFVGGVGWIDGSWHDIHTERMIHKEINYLSDFNAIEWYQETMKYDSTSAIAQACEQNENPVVAVTHYMPMPELVHPKYGDGVLNWCFANDWEEMFHPELATPDFWVCGHSHCKSPVEMIHNVAIQMNPLGYPGENINIAGELVLGEFLI